MQTLTGLGCGACSTNAAMRGLRGASTSGTLAVVLGLFAAAAVGFTIYGFKVHRKR